MAEIENHLQAACPANQPISTQPIGAAEPMDVPDDGHDLFESEGPRAWLCQQVEALRAVELRPFEMDPGRAHEELPSTTLGLITDAVRVILRLRQGLEAGVVDQSLADQINATLVTVQRNLRPTSAEERDQEPVTAVVEKLPQIRLCVTTGTFRRLSAEELDAESAAWVEIDRCSKALSSTLRALVHLEWQLCAAAGLESQLRLPSPLEVSLSIRRSCAALWWDAAVADPQPSELLPLLRSFATSLSTLVGNEIYPELPTRDRRQIRHVQGGVLAWLNGLDKSADEGLQLWRQARSLSRSLRKINQRKEMIEHDEQLMSELSVLFGRGRPLSTDMRNRIPLLLGHSEPIDALIGARCLEGSRWREALATAMAGKSPARAPLWSAPGT